MFSRVFANPLAEKMKSMSAMNGGLPPAESARPVRNLDSAHTEKNVLQASMPVERVA